MTNIVLNSLNELKNVAREMIVGLALNDNNKTINCLAFYGEMGAGKTTLIKAICAELGVADITNSPTFSIVNEYVTENQQSIFHFDFYRIGSESEAYDLGYEEYFYSENLCMIEWPEKIFKLLPLPYYKISIEVDNSEKRIISLQEIH